MLPRALLAMFASLQMLSSYLGGAIPLDHELVKRADINCRPSIQPLNCISSTA